MRKLNHKVPLYVFLVTDFFKKGMISCYVEVSLSYYSFLGAKNSFKRLIEKHYTYVRLNEC